MESNPDEFNLHGGKWASLFNHVKERVLDGNKNRLVILQDFECEALWGRFVKAGQAQLLTYVMKTILENDKHEQ
jgi:hypothetical protein